MPSARAHCTAARSQALQGAGRQLRETRLHVARLAEQALSALRRLVYLSQNFLDLLRRRRLGAGERRDAEQDRDRDPAPPVERSYQGFTNGADRRHTPAV